MRILPTKLDGVFLIQPELRRDERGYFFRTFCRREFEQAGLSGDFVQCNSSYNERRGTLRGMHFQAEPRPEGKLVRCTRGAIWDVVLDIREGSPTFGQWTAAELSVENGQALFIPAGFAHGFQTLAAETDVFYQMTEFYEAALSRGLRWNDPRFAIQWPIADPILSPKDASYADYQA